MYRNQFKIAKDQARLRILALGDIPVAQVSTQQLEPRMKHYFELIQNDPLLRKCTTFDLLDLWYRKVNYEQLTQKAQS